jgi:preprotein translocase subunit SecG
MQIILTILQVVLSLALIGLVLIQHGRGADAGAAFGSGASATVFGARGSGSFLSRATAILALLFFLTSMALAYYAAQSGRPEGLMDRVAPPQDQAPAVEVPAAPTATPSEVPLAPMGSSDGPQSPAEGEVPVVAIPAPPGDQGAESPPQGASAPQADTPPAVPPDAPQAQ